MNPSRWLAACLPASGALCLLLALASAAATAQTSATAPANPAGPAAEPAVRQAAPITMRQALEAAWQRSIEGAEAKDRQGRAQAERLVAGSRLAAPAAVSLGQREGAAGTAPGSRETEVGVSLPLWRPGQRAASMEAADTQARLAQAAEASARLRLAGQLREAAGALRLAETELRQAQRQAESLARLAQDVQRRVAAGDLARADTLAARAEALAAQAQASAARNAVQAHRSAWQLITGLDGLPPEETDPPAPHALPETHPDLVQAAAAVALGRHRLDLAQGFRPEAPELRVSTRQERPGAGAGPQTSVVIGLRLPLGGQAHLRPRVAAALGELAVAEARELRTRERLATELAMAVDAFRASEMQLQIERERSALLAERAHLIDLSFRAGETSLPEQLRALAAATAAEAAHARQQAARQLAAARLQQALGVTP